MRNSPTSDFVIIILLIVFFVSCSLKETGNRKGDLFFSSTIQDSLVSYLSRIDSIPEAFGNPSITIVALCRESTSNKLFFWSYPGWVAAIYDTAAVPFCSGRLNGKLVFVHGNPYFFRWVNRRAISLSKEDIELLKEKENTMQNVGCEVITSWECYQEYTIVSKDSLSPISSIFYGNRLY